MYEGENMNMEVDDASVDELVANLETSMYNMMDEMMKMFPEEMLKAFNMDISSM